MYVDSGTCWLEVKVPGPRDSTVKYRVPHEPCQQHTVDSGRDPDDLEAQAERVRRQEAEIAEQVEQQRASLDAAVVATPNRFQPAYIDPLGRSIRLGVRKKF